ncbi:MAG: 3-oxoacyl-ACP reductase FabG [Deltaproteobacteria bacterium]|nr:3-oxoacyl-ACP reductase FabG [Deltaproteobacteria bacterium]
MTTLLEGKVALVTGGSRGLGRALCEVFAREGAVVAFTYSRSDEAAEETAKSIAARGGKGLAFKGSVIVPAEVAEVTSKVERETGGIDILVNNAGIGQVVPLALMEELDWDRMMDVHVKGAFLMSRAVVRGMVRRKRGKILNIGSLAGVKMMEAPVHYSAAKAALRGMTESLAKELGRFGITVNCLAPGILEAGLSGDLSKERRAEYLRHCSLGRLGTTAEVAEMAAFLVSDRNSYMNGATIVLDGGL